MAVDVWTQIDGEVRDVLRATGCEGVNECDSDQKGVM